VKEPIMERSFGMPLWGLFAVIAVANVEVKAAAPAPKLYAFCVEAGVPGITPRPAGELARLLRDVGFDGVGHSYSYLAEPRLADDLRAYEAAGLQLYLAQTPINLDPKASSPYDPRVPDAIRRLKGRPTTVVVNLYGLKPADPAGMEPAVRYLRELGNVAAEADVRVSVYNHVDNWSESVAFCVDVVQKVNHPQVGFNFNLCHWLKVDGNKDYRPLLRANADKLFCVTICGATVKAETWTHGLIQPLDRGDFDNRALMAALREIGYRGPVGMMCYGIPGDAREHLQRSMKTWKSWFAEP
jgi:sugar phosphate isomerase/epimerase